MSVLRFVVLAAVLLLPTQSRAAALLFHAEVDAEFIAFGLETFEWTGPPGFAGGPVTSRPRKPSGVTPMISNGASCTSTVRPLTPGSRLKCRSHPLWLSTRTGVPPERASSAVSAVPEARGAGA